MAGSEPARSLLIVEDNDVEREGMSAILRREGFTVREARSGREALACLRANVPDLLILDMLLAGDGDDGWDVLREMRSTAAWAGIPVIIVTGLGIASPEWAVSLGAKAVVRKPVSTDELLDRVQQFLVGGG